MTILHDIALKKKFGQHFLRDSTIAESAVRHAKIAPGANVLEIGCGDGFLTRHLLQSPLARLYAYEIDTQWASYVAKHLQDPRLHIIEHNILDVHLDELAAYGAWILVANLPYGITIPILHLLQRHRHIIPSGVIMIQEEVAQKLIRTQGKDYGYISLFFQYHFDWKLLDKVPSDAFVPAPKVTSRLLKFSVRDTRENIHNENEFWQFVKLIFRQPRRTIRNNLSSSKYQADLIDKDILQLRAQQMSFAHILDLWHSVQK